MNIPMVCLKVRICMQISEEKMLVIIVCVLMRLF